MGVEGEDLGTKEYDKNILCKSLKNKLKKLEHAKIKGKIDFL